jgi:putative DNA primase/helicase
MYSLTYRTNSGTGAHSFSEATIVMNTQRRAGPEPFNSSEDTDASSLEAALEYARRGWHVFPVFEPTADGGCSCGNYGCERQGKHPRISGGFKKATTDAKQIQKWWKQWPSANIGIATGMVSGFWVLDVDPRNGGRESLARLEEEHHELPETRTVLTGGGGYHFYFASDGQKARTRKLAPGVEVKGEGGYVVAPPSLHVHGKRYQWGDR